MFGALQVLLPFLAPPLQPHLLASPRHRGLATALFCIFVFYVRGVPPRDLPFVHRPPLFLVPGGGLRPLPRPVCLYPPSPPHCISHSPSTFRTNVVDAVRRRVTISPTCIACLHTPDPPIVYHIPRLAAATCVGHLGQQLSSTPPCTCLRSLAHVCGHQHLQWSAPLVNSLFARFSSERIHRALITFLFGAKQSIVKAATLKRLEHGDQFEPLCRSDGEELEPSILDSSVSPYAQPLLTLSALTLVKFARGGLVCLQNPRTQTDGFLASSP